MYIDITITEEGEIEGEVFGVVGPGCDTLTEFLEDLGDTEEERKPEYYRRQQATVTRQHAG